MKYSLSKNLELERITGNKNQINLLYDLLTQRDYGVSHNLMPSLAMHAAFVKNHPYRIWFLVLYKKKLLGTIYLTKGNSIGLNISQYTCTIVKVLLCYILDKYEPLKEVKSVRPPFFYINIPMKNKKLKKCIECLGAQEIQSSYSLVTENLCKII